MFSSLFLFGWRVLDPKWELVLFSPAECVRHSLLIFQIYSICSFVIFTLLVLMAQNYNARYNLCWDVEELDSNLHCFISLLIPPQCMNSYFLVTSVKSKWCSYHQIGNVINLSNKIALCYFTAVILLQGCSTKWFSKEIYTYCIHKSILWSPPRIITSTGK